jgi:hypothetical protein
MKLYGSFLVRCWLIQGPSQNERSVYDVQHIQTGERLRVESLAEVQNWVIAACQASRFKQDLQPPDENES